MKRKIQCILFALQKKQEHPSINVSKDKDGNSVVKVYPISGDEAYELDIEGNQKIELNFGDRIRSISGTVFFKFEVESDSKTFVLSPDNEFIEDSKYRYELIIDEETTKLKTNENINFAEDISNLSLKTA